MIKGAIIGLGKMGISHASIVGANPQAELTAVCDTSSLVLEAFKKFSQAKVYSDYEKMLNEEELDFVIVATPTKYHYPMVKLALQKNIHVFCEKPFTLTTEQGRELVDLANEKKRINQVGYHNHFIGTFKELKRIINRRILGELVHFTGEAYGPVVTREKSGTWRSISQEGGGCLYDYASHVINLIQEILGRPEKTFGTLLKNIYSNGVEDAVYSLIGLENGLSGVIQVNWSDETFRKMTTSITVQGKNGKIICDATELKIYLKKAVPDENLDKGWTIKYITDLTEPVDFYLRGEEYSAQIDNFIKNVTNRNQNSINTFEQSLYTDHVIDMMIENAKNK